MTKKIDRAGRLYADMLTACQRRQHQDTLAVVLSCFLAALGLTRFDHVGCKSPGAISRFLNHQQWNTRLLIRAMRNHALRAFQASLRGRRGRPPVIEIIVDTTSIAKEGEFADLEGWIHTLNRVRGLHLVVLYVCCGELRLPWSFRIWRGKGQPSPNDLALKLVQQLPKEVRNRTRQLHFLADSGFSSVALLKGLTQLGMPFSVGMRKNRQTVEGQALHEITSQQRRVHLKGLPDLDLWVYWIWLPASKQNGQREQRFVITNRPRVPQVVRQFGRRRWKIEGLFKTLKSRFALGKFGQKTKQGVLRFLCLSFAAFLLCHLEFLDERASGAEQLAPDWGKLAQQVKHRLLGWVRLVEIEVERQQILAVLDEKRRDAA
ncbi:transposase [Deinococcus cavernae]|nr:transposase [Deinococcus cavernae]